MKREKDPDPTIRTLWGLARSRELSMTGEELHLVVQAQTGKDSMKKLTKKEIARVAYVLGQMKDSVRDGRPAKDRTSKATDNQLKKLKRLAENAGWEAKRLNGLTRRMFRVDSPEWLTYMQMSKLIEAVKAITKREAEDEGLQRHADG